MDEPELQEALEGLDLNNLRLFRTQLQTDAHDHIVEKELLQAFADSLSREEWTAAELLSSLESSDFFRTSTAAMTPVQRIRAGVIIRAFILDSLELEVRLREFSGVTMNGDIEVGIHRRVSALMDAHVIGDLEQAAVNSPVPVPLDVLPVSIGRLAGRIRAEMTENVRRREAQLAEMEHRVPVRFIVEKQRRMVLEARRDLKTVGDVLRSMSLEMRGQTDAAFFMREVSERLYEADPENAPALLQIIATSLGEMAGENSARNEPGYDTAPSIDRTLLLRDMQYRYADALKRAAGFHERDN